MRLLPLVASCALVIAAPAWAQDAAIPPTPATPVADDFDRETITLGAGIVALPEYEGARNYRLTPAPGALGTFKGYSFQLAGNRLSVDVVKSPSGPTWDFQAGPIGVLNLNRRSVDGLENQQVRALGDIGTAIELGGFVGIGKTGVITSPYDKLSAAISYRRDVNGAHGSGIWQPTISYLTPFSRKAAGTVFVSGEIVSDRFARTYYSVDAAGSARSGLPVYTADGGFKNWNLGLVGTYALTGDLLQGLKLVAGGTYGRLLGDFGRSPVTERRTQLLGAVGLAYTF